MPHPDECPTYPSQRRQGTDPAHTAAAEAAAVEAEEAEEEVAAAEAEAVPAVNQSYRLP